MDSACCVKCKGVDSFAKFVTFTLIRFMKFSFPPKRGWTGCGIALAFLFLVPVHAQRKDAKTPGPAASDLEYLPIREFANSEQAGGFLQLAHRKQMTEEDHNVLQRLQREKEAEYKQLDGQLLDRFSLSSALEYEYEAETKTIYRKAGDGEDKANRKVIYQFKNEAGEQDFLRLVAAKRLTANATATLKLLILEKQKELELLDKQLKEQYGIQGDLDYYYDAKKMTLFEVKAKK